MRPMTIDPGFLPYLEQAIASRSEPLHQANVAERRARMAAQRAGLMQPPSSDIEVAWHVVERDGPPLRALIFRPKQRPNAPAILYCHGGGWMYGSPEQSAELAYLYVKETGAVVVSPEYRLSPEHPFPCGFEDCYATLAWVAKEGAQLGIDARRIAVAGESSGGNLAAACALASRDRGGPEISLQVLNYPALGTDFGTSSYRDNADAPILSRDEMMYFWRAYLSGNLERPSPYAAPLAAGDLAGIAAAHIIVAEYDPLRDDGLTFADRLNDAAVPVTLRHATRLPHGFFRGLKVSPDAQALAAAVCDAFRSAFAI